MTVVNAFVTSSSIEPPRSAKRYLASLRSLRSPCIYFSFGSPGPHSPPRLRRNQPDGWAQPRCGPLVQSPRLSETEDCLNQRRPTGHTCGVRGNNASIRGSVNPHNLSLEPHTLSRNEMPFETTCILRRVAKLANYSRRACLQHELFRNDKIARRRLIAAVESGGEGKWAVGNEVVEPARVVLPIERQPSPLDAAVDCQHPVWGQVESHTWRKCSGREG